MHTHDTGFAYEGGALQAEGVSAARIAREVGSPCYVYSRRGVLGGFSRLRDGFGDADPLVCYSVKANGNLSVLRLLAGAGAGFDVVSGGELFRALEAGAEPDRIVFAGVGKTDPELRDALAAGIHLFDVESEPELERLSALAGPLGRRARVAIRVNPDVDPKTHRYTATGKRENKFGVDLERAQHAVERAQALPHLDLAGLHMHIGSQITRSAPYEEAVSRLLRFVDALRADGVELELLNLGGGFGIDYHGTGEALPLGVFSKVVAKPIRERGLRLVIEPGRYIAGPAGVLLTRVTYVKRSGEGRRFVICDAGMHTLLRPSLYGAYHRIWPVEAARGPEAAADLPAGSEADIVGPICESGDFLAKERPFPEVRRGDLLCVFDAGAYGFAMASQYNAHPRPPEVLVEGDTFRTVRRRETYEDLVRHER